MKSLLDYDITFTGEIKAGNVEFTMKIVVPVTLLLIFLLLYLNFRRLTETFIVMLSVPFALVGGVWLMWWLGYNLAVAVAVGFIALAGVAAEFGVVMLLYLSHAWEARLARGEPASLATLDAAIEEGAVQRVRYTGATVCMPNELHVTDRGITIGFTSALDTASAALDIETRSFGVRVACLMPGPFKTSLPQKLNEFAILVTARQWGAQMTDDDNISGFPFLRRRGPLALIGVTSGVPTAPFLATGRLGEKQLSRLAEALDQLAAQKIGAETRFLVLPMRPADTQGMNEAQLAARVTRASGASDQPSPAI